MREELSGPYRTGLVLLFGAIVLVLVMVCLNLGVLHAVRADGRRGERAVQAALGASPTRLVRQSLLESGVLVLTSAALGTALAVVFVRGVRRLGVVALPFVGEASLDGRGAAFGVASALCALFVAGVLPLTGANVRTDFAVEGRPPATAAEAPGAQSRFVSPGYFETVGIPVIQGRGFDERDATGGRPVVVVDQALARRFFGDDDPIGQALLMTDRQPARRAEVVGVVGNVKHFGLDEEPLATLYAPFGQAHEPVFGFILGGATLVVRSDVAPAATLPGVREALASVDPDLPTTAARTMENVLQTLLAPRRLSFWAVSFFGGAALGLALTGVYGSVSQALRQRQREVAIRLALGARSRDVIAMLAAQGFSPVLAGAGLGIVATLAGGPFLERTSLIFATSPRDLPTLSVTPALVALVSAVIATLVARRAARVAPLQALRGD